MIGDLKDLNEHCLPLLDHHIAPRSQAVSIARSVAPPSHLFRVFVSSSVCPVWPQVKRVSMFLSPLWFSGPGLSVCVCVCSFVQSGNELHFSRRGPRKSSQKWHRAAKVDELIVFTCPNRKTLLQFECLCDNWLVK